MDDVLRHQRLLAEASVAPSIGVSAARIWPDLEPASTPAPRPQSLLARDNADYLATIGAGGTMADLDALTASGFKAGAILADPPWSFKTYSDSGKGRAPDRHYAVMPLDDIKAMGARIRAVAAEDCALFLWCTWPLLSAGQIHEILRAWGFTPKTCGFIWVKLTKTGTPALGTGYWSRANSEPCLLATRGRPKRFARNVGQVVLAPRGRHSEKPAEVRDRIERLVGGPYLELFARQTAPGWRSWGNEIPRVGVSS